MKKIVLIAAIAALAGCATQAVKSHSQNYRPKGQGNAVSIQGAVLVKPGVLSNDYAALVRIDESKGFGFQLDAAGNGEYSCTAKKKTELDYCEPVEGHKTSASCTGSTVNGNVARVTCFVFYDDEKAATFTF